MKELYWKYSLITLILFLGYILFQQAQPFMNGILGAFTLYLLLRKATFRLSEKMSYSRAVWTVTIGTLLFIVIPISLMGWLLISEITSIDINPRELLRPAFAMISFIKEKTGFNVLSESTLSLIAGQIPAIGQSIMSGVSDFFVNVAVAIMLLYFLLSGGRRSGADSPGPGRTLRSADGNAESASRSRRQKRKSGPAGPRGKAIHPARNGRTTTKSRMQEAERYKRGFPAKGIPQSADTSTTPPPFHAAAEFRRAEKNKDKNGAAADRRTISPSGTDSATCFQADTER